MENWRGFLSEAEVSPGVSKKTADAVKKLEDEEKKGAGEEEKASKKTSDAMKAVGDNFSKDQPKALDATKDAFGEMEKGITNGNNHSRISSK